ncbi:unnamed protein product [Somion occarium]|uniref:Large ribosomal subunit protein uL30-like ferredoxin-like fold domain-containing protein n=1 Tax=Somion occarium TaxID=3059160 RepID=A0ABP1E880_9APHY
MIFSLRPNVLRQSVQIPSRRLLATTSAQTASATQSPPPSPSSTSPASSSSSQAPLTHYKITLQRSAISLAPRMKATLVSLGIHRRLQTVFHPHNPINAGKILRVKELVHVENVSADEVRTKTEQRRERRPARGYVRVASKLGESI